MFSAPLNHRLPCNIRRGNFNLHRIVFIRFNHINQSFCSGFADKCEVQLSYAIGVAHPTSIMIDSYGTGKLSDNKLTDIVRENFDLRPAGIIKMLDLRRPIYKQTSAYGHFGRNDLDLPWEKLDKVEDLKKYL